MNPTVIVLIVVALGVAAVVWFSRRKPEVTKTGPQEADTAWNDTVEGVRPEDAARVNAIADAPPARDPLP